MVKYSKTYIGKPKFIVIVAYNILLEFHYNDPVIGLKCHCNDHLMS